MRYYEYNLEKITIGDIEINCKEKIIAKSKEEMENKLKDLLLDIYNKYLTKEISYDEIYDKLNPLFHVSVNAEHYKEFDSFEEVSDYYKSTKDTIRAEDLFDYLMTFIDDCHFIYDYKMNLLEAKCINNEWYNSFSYKSLFPYKYHLDKYNTGDKVRYKYNRKIYTVWKFKEGNGNSIYESNDPLNYREGYYLLDDTGRIYDGGDMYSYLAVDEDLEPVNEEYQILTKEKLDDFISYINISDKALVIREVIYDIKYNKFRREDDEFKIKAVYKNSEIDITNILFAVSFYDNDKRLLSIINSYFINSFSNMEVDNIRIYHNNILVKEISKDNLNNYNSIDVVIIEN